MTELRTTLGLILTPLLFFILRTPGVASELLLGMVEWISQGPNGSTLESAPIYSNGIHYEATWDGVIIGEAAYLALEAKRFQALQAGLLLFTL